MGDERWVFLNGIFCREKEATIPVTDRGFLFGDGLFTTMRVHDGQCEFFQRHLKRLDDQSALLNFCSPKIEWNTILELIQRNCALNGTWRLKIILTVKQEGRVRSAGTLLMTLQPYEGGGGKPAALCLYPHPIERPLANVKSLSYLDHLQVREYAHQQGKEDAIIQMVDGVMLETGCSNLFWIDRGVCYIPALDLPYLKGICLQVLLEHLPLPCNGVKATLDKISSSSNLYVCNALTWVRPVLSVGERQFSRDEEYESMLQTAMKNASRSRYGF